MPMHIQVVSRMHDLQLASTPVPDSRALPWPRRGGTQGLKSQTWVPRHVPPEARYAAFPRHAGYIHALGHMCGDTLQKPTRFCGFRGGCDYLMCFSPAGGVCWRKLPGAGCTWTHWGTIAFICQCPSYHCVTTKDSGTLWMPVHLVAQKQKHHRRTTHAGTHHI